MLLVFTLNATEEKKCMEYGGKYPDSWQLLKLKWRIEEGFLYHYFYFCLFENVHNKNLQNY